MTVDNKMAIKLHEFYENHKIMWMKIADILRTDYEKLGFSGNIVKQLKKLSLEEMGVRLIGIDSYCFCCAASKDLGDEVYFCASQCIVNWGDNGCVLSTNSLYVKFCFHLEHFANMRRFYDKDVIERYVDTLVEEAEDIANLLFRYQEEYDRAIKEGA